MWNLVERRKSIRMFNPSLTYRKGQERTFRRFNLEGIGIWILEYETSGVFLIKTCTIRKDVPDEGFVLSVFGVVFETCLRRRGLNKSHDNFTPSAECPV